MKNDREPLRKPAERKPSPVNNNIVFILIILCVVTLVGVIFMSNRPDEKLSYSDLVQVIKLSDAPAGQNAVEVTREKGDTQYKVKFSRPTDIKIGSYEISGKITRDNPLEKPAVAEVNFQTNTKPGNERIAQLLEEKHIEFDNSDGPSAWPPTFRC